MPNVLKDDPQRAKVRKLNELPRETMSKMLTVEDKRANPYTDTDEPTRAKLRILMLDPSCKKSSTEQLDPMREKP